MSTEIVLATIGNDYESLMQDKRLAKALSTLSKVLMKACQTLVCLPVTGSWRNRGLFCSEVLTF